MTIGDVDFSKLQDRKYLGSFKGTVEGSLRDVTLEVIVSGGAVSDIRILRRG
ncbi:MAG: hypothetical protein R2912_05780 [Eubacteriales bacterium]